MKTILALIFTFACIAIAEAKSYKISVPVDSKEQGAELIKTLTRLILEKYDWVEFKTDYDLAVEEKYPDLKQKSDSLYFKGQADFKSPDIKIKKEGKTLVTIEFEIRRELVERTEKLKEEVISTISEIFPSYSIQTLNPEIAL